MLTPLPTLPTLTAPARAQASAPLPESDPNNLLMSLVEKPMSGLAAIGNVLDLPGSMVRDVLAGENPVDQLLSPLSFENRTTGRDLLRKYDMIGDEDTWGNFAGGLGAEILLDPTTYLTFGAGALTKGGQALKGAGLLDDVAKAAAKKGVKRLGVQTSKDAGKRLSGMSTNIGDLFALTSKGELPAGSVSKAQKIANAAKGAGTKITDDLVTEPIARLFGGNLPFARNPSVTFGGGKTAKTVASLMDTAGEAVRYSAPVRTLASLFDGRLQDTVSETGQKIASEASRRIEDSTAAALKPLADDISVIERSGLFSPDDIAKSHGPFDQFDVGVNEVTNRHSGKLLDFLESKNPDVGELLTYLTDDAKIAPENAAQVVQSLRRVKGTLPRLLEDANQAGVNTKALEDFFTDYFPRSRTSFDDDILGRAGRGTTTLDSGTPSQIRRKDIMRDWSGGTSVLNDISVDRGLRAIAERRGAITDETVSEAVDYLIDNYSGRLKRPGADGLAQEVTRDTDELKKLAKWAMNLNPKHVDQQIPVFAGNPLSSYETYLKHAARSKEVANMTYEIMSDHAQLLDDVPGTHNPSLRDVLRQSNLENHVAEDRLIERLQANPEWTGKLAGKSKSEILDELFIPKDLAADMGRYVKSFTAPESANKFMQAVDTFLQTWKTGVTALYPSFHLRNQVSGLFQNFIGGAYDKGMPLKGVWDMMNGKTWKGASSIPAYSHLSPEKATKAMLSDYYAHGVGGSHQGMIGETLSESASRMSDAIPGSQGTVRGSFKAPAGTTMGQAANPLGVVTQSGKFFPERIGRTVGKHVEDMSRLSGFAGFLKQGLDPAEAARQVKKLQVDYGALSKTERTVLRRVFPFYSFTRGTLPPFLEELVERPGGRLGRTIMATGSARDTDALTPEHIAGTASIPLGELEDGSQRYLTGFGLMHEDPAKFGALLSNPTGAALDIAGRLNPLLKFPLEYGTGRSFFQNRPLEDMDPTYGRLIANLQGKPSDYDAPPLVSNTFETMLGNTPVSRLGTTARMLTDQRKGVGVKALNALTGARISDVSPGAQDAIMREMVQDLMRKAGAGEFTRINFREEDLAEMAPENRQAAEQMQALLDLLVQRAKARRQAKRA